MTEKRWPRLLVQNDPYPMRINKELAEEIGFNESIIFLQLEYLIATSTTKEIDGELWTYQSLSDLRKKYFPWWSLATIARILKSLEEKKLIKIGCHNKLGFDRTQWYCFNQEGIAQLKSVQMDTSIFQNEKCKRANCKMDDSKMINASEQIETTIPETPTQITTEIKEQGAKTAPPLQAPDQKDSSEEETPAAQKKRERKELYQIAQALAHVCSMDFTKNRGRLFREAKEFKVEEIRKIQCDYGPGGWWWKTYWIGNVKGEYPTPDAIRKTWDLPRNTTPAPTAAPADYEPTPAQVEAQQIEIAETERLFRLAQERKQQEARP